MTNNYPFWVVTDLDGTLMDEHYDITPAKETLNWLADLSIPVIPCTSKTASEVRYFRSDNELFDPYIVENGAAVYGLHTDETIEWELILGRSYKELRNVLNFLSNDVGYDLKPLNELNTNEIHDLTGLGPKEIKRALDRHWSVPFLNPPDIISERIKLFCKQYNVHIFKGNRMSHLLCINSHKGEAVNKLKDYLQKPNINVIALGDSQNDLPLLDYADISIVIPGKNGPNKYLIEGINCGKYILAEAPHAFGWSDSVRKIIQTKLNL